MFRPAGKSTNVERDVLVAATPEQMRGLLDNFTSEALRGNVSPEAFSEGLMTLSEAGQSPNFTARNIRNTLKNPLASTLLDNPDLAENMARSSLGMLDSLGINSSAASGYIGPGMDLLKQAKADGILRADVTDEEVAKEIQRPLYSAIQSWRDDNKNNTQLHDYLGNGNDSWNPNWGGKPITRQESFFTDY